MKRISHAQSRKNSRLAAAQGARRHARAGALRTARPKPMLGAGRVHYEIGANTDATSYGGIAAVHRLVTRLGLVAGDRRKLKLLKVHLPYHESDHVLNLAYNVMCGGTRLEDIERLRHDTAYMNGLGARLIPDPTTSGRLLPPLHEADMLTLMDASTRCGRSCGGAGARRCWAR